MRQFKIAKPLPPDQKAEAAEAFQWLEQQPVPPGLSGAELKPMFRYIVAMARQYKKQGLPLRKLVAIGYQAGLAAPGLWSWRVREGMAAAYNGIIIGVSC